MLCWSDIIKSKYYFCWGKTYFDFFYHLNNHFYIGLLCSKYTYKCLKYWQIHTWDSFLPLLPHPAAHAVRYKWINFITLMDCKYVNLMDPPVFLCYPITPAYKRLQNFHYIGPSVKHWVSYFIFLCLSPQGSIYINEMLDNPPQSSNQTTVPLQQQRPLKSDSQRLLWHTSAVVFAGWAGSWYALHPVLPLSQSK